MTPYDKLKFLDNAERFLNPGVTFDPTRRHRPARQ